MDINGGTRVLANATYQIVKFGPEDYNQILPETAHEEDNTADLAEIKAASPRLSISCRKQSGKYRHRQSHPETSRKARGTSASLPKTPPPGTVEKRRGKKRTLAGGPLLIVSGGRHDPESLEGVSYPA